jgi:uridine kinase
MKGDILIIHNLHRKAARQAVELMLPEISGFDGKYCITVAGESGAGKSEIAAAIAAVLEKKGYPAYIFQQDDYFIYPPKTNAAKRKEDIGWVGMQEVKLSQLDANIEAARTGTGIIEKPLVIFNEDLITSETADLGNYKVLIAEGTYTTALKQADCRIFIDRNQEDTKKARLKRGREKQDAFLEQILRIEHGIISAQKKNADIIITRQYEAIKQARHE